MPSRFANFPSRKDPNYTEYYQALDWITIGLLISLFVAVMSSFVAVPLGYLASHGISTQSWAQVKRFYAYLSGHPLYYFESYWSWMAAFFKDPLQSFAVWIPFLPFGVFGAGVGITIKTNPYYFVSYEMGGGRFADERDVKKLGLWNGFTYVLGLWNDRHLLRMNNYMSMLVVGAGGCGKTAGVVVPTILKNDDKCLIVNDIKGELWELTAGYRSKLGPVFNIYFFGIDDPEKGVFWPTWNPLSDQDIPPPSPGRQAYIGGLAYFLLDDGPTGTDPYWIKAGRAVLEGFINYICDKCEQARANDYFLQRLYEETMDDEDYEVLETYYQAMAQSVAVKQALEHVRNKTVTFKNYLPIGKWDPIPEAWAGRQASFPMMVDMITKRQLDISGELRARRDAGDRKAYKADVWATILEDIVEEADYFGYNRRCIVEIGQIQVLPKSQRSSVLSMALSGLAPFKNAAIRARMASSDFGSVQMRGIKNPLTGEWEPVTFYLSTPIDGMTNKVMTMFVNMYSGTPTIFGPNEGPCGPYPILFILDDYHYMSTLHVADAMGIGMSKQFSFMLVCQDLSQLSGYGGEVETIIGNTGAKVFMRCDSRDTASLFSSMIETRTRASSSTNRDEGIGSGTTIFTPYNVSYSAVAARLLVPSSIMNMPFGRQYALIQKHFNRPIKLKTPYYFKDREMTKKTKIAAPSSFLPLYVYDRRAAEDKLPPPEDMSVEPEYMKAVKIGEREEMEEAEREEAEAQAAAENASAG